MAVIEVRHLHSRPAFEGYVRHTAELSSPTERHEIWWATPDDARPISDDWLLGAGLVFAMRLGAPLRVIGRVDRRLAASAEAIQRQIVTRDDALRVVPVECEDVAVPVEAPGTRSLACFSAGLDSFHTALDPAAGADDLLYVHGYEARRSDRAQLFTLLPSVKAAARDLGKPLRLVETNYLDVAFRTRHMSVFAYLPMVLVSTLLMGSRYGRLVVPAGRDTQRSAVYSTGLRHYLPLWSTETFEASVHGLTTRLEKARTVARSEPALRWLHVCWASDGRAYNCGRCRKCVRTAVNLALAGAEGRCASLPEKVPLDLVARPVPPRYRDFVIENLEEAEAQGQEDLAVALRTALEGTAPAPSPWSRPWHELARLGRRVTRSLAKRRTRHRLARHDARHGGAHLFRSVGPAPPG